MSHPRIALGTVQFGMSYGVANQSGQVDIEEAAAILACAYSAGLDTLDTAVAYGESEAQLGQMGVGDWQIISKLAPLPQSTLDVNAWVNASVRGSLARLNVSFLDGLLLHRASDILGPQGQALYRALIGLKAQGLVKKIGISIYQPDELEAIFDQMHFDIVQAPFSIFDRRLVASGWLKRLHDVGVEVHARSVFLQGLLLMPYAERPAKFLRWQSLWDEWDRWLLCKQLTPLEACLRYVLAFSEIHRVIVGVDTAAQLKEILSASGGVLPPVPAELQSRDVALLNPSNWHLL